MAFAHKNCFYFCSRRRGKGGYRRQASCTDGQRHKRRGASAGASGENPQGQCTGKAQTTKPCRGKWPGRQTGRGRKALRHRPLRPGRACKPAEGKSSLEHRPQGHGQGLQTGRGGESPLRAQAARARAGPADWQRGRAHSGTGRKGWAGPQPNSRTRMPPSVSISAPHERVTIWAKGKSSIRSAPESTATLPLPPMLVVHMPAAMADSTG